MMWLLRTAFFAVLVAMTLSVAAQSSEPAAPITDVYVKGESGYNTFRIPSLLLTPKGTLLAFAEARKDSARDGGHTEIALKRSTDGGKTWGPLAIIVADPPNAVCNPCAVVERQSGTIFLLHTRNLGSDSEKAILAGTSKGTCTVWVTSSTDDGVTWSKPHEITPDVKDKSWTWYATGPGVGIQLASGRLLIPCNDALAGSKTYQSHTIYSDDRGATWKLGGVAGVLGNESQAVELSDGSVMTNMRSYRGKHSRAVSISKDGGQTWSAVHDDPALVEPVCQASITRIVRGGKVSLLFTNPADPKSRRNLTLRISDDDGKTWPRSLVLYSGSAAYSCLTPLDDGTVACLFEADNYARIVLMRVRI
jgi:sialidase-1